MPGLPMPRGLTGNPGGGESEPPSGMRPGWLERMGDRSRPANADGLDGCGSMRLLLLGGEPNNPW